MKKFRNRSKRFKLFLLIMVGIVFYSTIKHAERISFSYSEQIRKSEKVLDGSELSIFTEKAVIIVEELKPLLEYIADKKLKWPVEVKLATRTELVNVCFKDLMLQLKNILEFQNEAKIIELANFEALKMSNFIVGKYGLVDKVLYLVPENMEVFQIMNTGKSQNFELIFKLIIAHELTHVLQDQELDISGKAGNWESLEEIEAFKAIIEGHALFIQQQVGNHLKIENEIVKSSKILSVDFDNGLNSIDTLRDKIDDLSVKESYKQGRKFIEYYFKKGGNQLIWKILSNAPTNTLMILEPTTYAVKKPLRFNSAALLEGLEDSYGNQNWDIENFSVPIIRFHSALLALDKKDCQDVASKMSFMQTLRFSKQNKVYGTITVIKMNDEHYRKKIISILKSIIRQSVDTMKENSKLIVKNIVSESLIGMSGEILSKLSYSIKDEAGKNFNFVVVYFDQKDLIIEISGETSYISDDKIIEISAEIFKRYKQGKYLSNVESSQPFRDLPIINQGGPS